MTRTFAPRTAFESASTTRTAADAKWHNDEDLAASCPHLRQGGTIEIREIDRHIRSLEDAIAIFNRVLSVSRVLRTDVQPIANPNETSLAEATGTGLKTDGIAPLQSMGVLRSRSLARNHASAALMPRTMSIAESSAWGRAGLLM